MRRVFQSRLVLSIRKCTCGWIVIDISKPAFVDEKGSKHGVEPRISDRKAMVSETRYKNRLADKELLELEQNARSY